MSDVKAIAVDLPITFLSLTAEERYDVVLAKAIRIYQGAVDPTMGLEQGAMWWEEVIAELAAVIAAPDTATAAGIIAWWHHDWRAVGRTPQRVAGRIRRHAARQKYIGIPPSRATVLGLG